MMRAEDGPRVVIIGGGLGGISVAIALKTQLGFHNFTIYEKAGDVGGTWRDNTYPGCACDTPTHWYSLSTELNPHWTTTMAPQPELLAYWQGLATKHDLYSRTVFHTNVLSASWDATRREYDLVLEDVRTREQTRTAARAVVSAVGILSEPYVPQINGMHAFKGDLFHSARWDHTVDMRGKRIAVVGNGASAAQFIPHLVADPTTQVVHFCRTPNWYIYGPREVHCALLRWFLAHVPLALRAYRLYTVAARLARPYIQRYLNILLGGKGGTEDLVNYIKRTSPPKYHAQLIPSYPIACRRPILDPGYLACLHAPNVQLNWDGIEEIVPDGIRTSKGDMLAFDTIILGTGFVTGKYPISVTGSTGRTLAAFDAAQGGPSAYLGVCVPEFPNYFFIGGPNTVTGNGSAVFTHEIETNYTLQLLRPLLHCPRASSSHKYFPFTSTLPFLSSSPHPGPTSLTVRAPAHAAYNTHLQAAMFGATYAGCPPSWFRVSGKNVSLFPWTHLWFWCLLARVRWADFELRMDGVEEGVA